METYEVAWRSLIRGGGTRRGEDKARGGGRHGVLTGRVKKSGTRLWGGGAGGGIKEGGRGNRSLGETKENSWRGVLVGWLL